MSIQEQLAALKAENEALKAKVQAGAKAFTVEYLPPGRTWTNKALGKSGVAKKGAYRISGNFPPFNISEAAAQELKANFAIFGKSVS